MNEIQVDPSDRHLLDAHKWHMSSDGYPAARMSDNGRRGKIRKLHQIIMGEPPFDGAEVDHINGDKTDNRRHNLRWATKQQNQFNSVSRLGTSRHKGVHWSKCAGRWAAAIRLDGESRHLGYFDAEDDAARAYNNAAAELYGEYARLNDVT